MIQVKLPRVQCIYVLFFIITFCNLNAQCWKAIDTGFSHTLAIRSDGTLWSWGDNSDNRGAVGQGTGLYFFCIPKQVGIDNDWVSISAGNHYSLGIKANGTLWACGSNQGYGSTGFLTNLDTHVFTQVDTSTNWKSVSAGQFLAIGIKNDGTLWSWSSAGVTSVGGNLNNGIPSRIPTQVGNATDWKEVSCGSNYSLAIKNNNTLWARGYNAYGELGIGNTITNTTFVQVGTETNWKTISAGEYSSLGIKLDGSLWAWGRNNLGQLGDGTTLTKLIPTRIGTANDWNNVTSCDYQHSFGIKINGTLWGWGNNSRAYLGDGTTINRIVPTQIGSETNWANIASGWYTLGIKIDNTLWGCGDNRLLGIGIPNGTVNSSTLLNLNYQKIICSDPIIANNDVATSIFGITSTALNNILINDSFYLNSANVSNVKITFISSTNSGITLNTATGSVNVSNTVPIGNYSLTYYINDINLNPSLSIVCGCGSYGVVNINVKPSIDATDDDFSSIPINNAIGGSTTSVIANDLLNGVTVNNTDVTISLINDGGLIGTSINSNGIISIPAGFPSNIYTLTYSICQNSNPTNCDTATIYIAVSEPFVQTPNIVFGTRANNTVNLVEIQSDSKILIGGTFDKYNNINSYKIARLNSDLTLDSSFLSTGPMPIDKNPRDMKIQADGKIILVGSFDSFNGGSNGRGIIRLNTNGTVDTSFNTGGTGIPSGTNQSINTCAIQSDGKILLGGGFIDSFNGINTRNLIRLNQNGTLDTSFSYPYVINRSIISKIKIQSDGKILVGGVYKGGTTTDPGQPSVFRLNIDGSLDNTFTTSPSGVNVFTTNCTSCISAIQNIIPLQNGKILIVGVFNTYTFNSLPYKNIIRLNNDGTIDTTFNANLSTNRVIKDAVIEASGKMIIGGEFTTFNGNAVNKIIRLNVNGSLDSTFSSGLGLYDDLSNGSNLYNNIQVLKRQEDGKIILGGRFTAYNFIGANCITRITPSIAGGQARSSSSSIQYNDIEEEHEDVITDKYSSAEILLFPNPSNGNLYLKLTDFRDNTSFELYSIFNQKIINTTNVKESSVLISKLKLGMYIIKINHNGKLITRKIVVN